MENLFNFIVIHLISLNELNELNKLNLIFWNLGTPGIKWIK